MVVQLFLLFGAGVASFLAPCVVALVPAYLGAVAGDAGARRGRPVVPVLGFVGGFSATFAALGAAAGALGDGLLRFEGVLRVAGGAVLLVMGLRLLGRLGGVLDREWRPGLTRLAASRTTTRTSAVEPAAADVPDRHPDARGVATGCRGRLPAPPPAVDLLAAAGRAAGPTAQLLGARSDDAEADPSSSRVATAGANRVETRTRLARPVLLGAAFAAGWTPCVGPVLAAALTAAATGADPVRGAALLGAYGVGLGTPFVIAALGIQAGVPRRMAAVGARIEPIAGVVLVALGALLLTDTYDVLASRIAGLAPQIGSA